MKSPLGFLRIHKAKKLREFGYEIRDWFWPTVVLHASPLLNTATKVEWPEKNPSTTDTLEASYALLKDELKAEDDRSKIVESKLQGILSLVPLAMTIVFAVVTFFISGKVVSTSLKIVVTEFAGVFYIALQILRALLAVVSGLSSRSYTHLHIDDAIPKEKEDKESYLNRICKEIFDIIRSNREVTDGKVSQLKLGHRAIRNAVWGLFIVIGAILTITVFENYIR